MSKRGASQMNDPSKLTYGEQNPRAPPGSVDIAGPNVTVNSGSAGIAIREQARPVEQKRKLTPGSVRALLETTSDAGQVRRLI